MTHTLQHSEQLKGNISVTMANNQTLDDFAAEYINDYNRDRFEALAIRILLGKETIVTVFAVDKIRQEDSILSEGRLPVKKFKLTEVPLSAVLSYCSSFNCTISTGNYELDDMEVMNK